MPTLMTTLGVISANHVNKFPTSGCESSNNSAPNYSVEYSGMIKNSNNSLAYGRTHGYSSINYSSNTFRSTHYTMYL